MPSATSTLTTAPAAIAPPAPAGLRLQLDPTMAGTGAVDGRRVHVGWFRHMDAHTIGLTRAFQDRVALLVVPPQATTAAAGVAMAGVAMAMAADAASSVGPADILAAAGVGGEDPDPNAPGHSG